MKTALRIAIVIAAFAVVEPAFADGPGAFDWTGSYVGVKVGYGWQGEPVTYRPENAGYADVVPKSLDTKSKGGFGGGVLGFNSQAGQMVYGVEADLSGVDLSGDKYFRFVSPITFIDTTAKMKLEAFGTVRGRIGFTTVDHALLYATGGLAYGHATLASSETSLFFNNSVFCAPSGLCASRTTTQWNLGWTLGAGWEQPVAPNWSVKLEYLYYDLGSVSHTTFDPKNPTGGRFDTSADFRGQMVSVGLNYRFGGP